MVCDAVFYVDREGKQLLLQLALGLHALVVVQDLLADAQILRGDLQQLIPCQELQAALQAQLAYRGSGAERFIGTGSAEAVRCLVLQTLTSTSSPEAV